MKALFLSAALGGLFVNPANASLVSIGGSHAKSCYQAAEARSTTQESIEECDFALREESLSAADRAATYVNRGVLHLYVRNVAAAERDFNAAIAVNAQEPEAWLNRSIASITRGNSAAAMPLVERALALRTRKPALAHYVRGIAHEDLGNLRAAYADLVRAQALAPEWSEPARELQRYSVKP